MSTGHSGSPSEYDATAHSSPGETAAADTRAGADASASGDAPASASSPIFVSVPAIVSTAGTDTAQTHEQAAVAGHASTSPEAPVFVSVPALTPASPVVSDSAPAPEASGSTDEPPCSESPAADNSPAAEMAPPPEKSVFFSGRALCVYLLAVALLALLESGRLQTFLEQSDFPGAEQLAVLVREAAWFSGATLVSNAETRLVRQFSVDSTIGAVSPDAAPVTTIVSLATSASATPSGVFVPPMPGRDTLPRESAVREIPVRDTAVREIPVREASTPQVRQAAVPSVLIVGDSLIMEGLGPSLHRTLRKRTDITVIREGRYSTGLTRTDTFNWPDRIRELVQEHDPDIILVCLGANDSQDIIVDGKRRITGTPVWQTLYRERADRFLAAATSKGATVIWLGLPIMGKPAYEKRIRLLSDLQEAACEAEPLCRFQNGVPALTDADGNYLAFILDDKGQHVRLRYKDMVHVTEPGGQKLVDAAMPLIDQVVADVKTGITLPPAAADAVPLPDSAGASPASETPAVAPVVPDNTPDTTPERDAFDTLFK